MTFNPQVVETKEFDLIPEGLHAARVARVIELGVQKTPYGDKEQVVFEFVLPNETIEIDGVEKQKMKWGWPLNQTSNPDGNLMKLVKAIKPDATSLAQLVGLPCMLEISHAEDKKGVMRDNISNVTKPMAGIDIPEPDIDTYFYEFSNGEDAVFDNLNEYRQKQIKAAVNWEE